jgi:hypothetical protein
MRSLKVVLLLLAILLLLTSVFFVGTDTGLTLWYATVAVLLIDVVVCLIWPSASGQDP